MTPEQQAELQSVNTRVNAIPYNALTAPDEPPDWWTDSLVHGRSFVCRDYVLQKADELKALGWPASALTVILCFTEPVRPPPDDREYHAVLGVDVDGQTWVLDSRFDDIYLWTQPPADYRWDRQQIAGTTEFRDASTGLV